MTPHTATPHVPPASPDVVAARHGAVVRRIAAECDLDLGAARRRFEETVRFLDLVAEGHGPLVPSRTLDDAWHAFVLHTRAYAAFCEERYGFFVHHDPDDGGADTANRDGYLRTRALVEARFGPLDPEAWPAPHAHADCGGEGECKGEGNCKADCKADCDGDCSGSG